MTGNFVDNFRYYFKRAPSNSQDETFFLDTDYGRIRVLDTQENKPVIINVPDGPNVIEHHQNLIRKLSNYFRVICFEYPGLGFSYPSVRFDYSFKNGSSLMLQIMDILNVKRATALFSCSNGFYAMKAAEVAPDRLEHIFLSQTPSLKAMMEWTKKSIPSTLKIPVVGQVANAAMARKLANLWYQYALPKGTNLEDYRNKALHAIDHGGCFCLSGLVHGMQKEAHQSLSVSEVPSTLVWGEKDFTHRYTDNQRIRDHIKTCEIIIFPGCGHFPELERTGAYIQLIRERVRS